MRRWVIATLIGVLVLLTAACSGAATTDAQTAMPAMSGMTTSASAGVQQVDPAAFASAIDGDRYTINVHIPNEGSLPATDLTLPYNEVEQRAGELPTDKNTPLAIYCMTGHMSAIAGQTLTDLGYTDIVELKGGMEAWQASGKSLIPESG